MERFSVTLWIKNHYYRPYGKTSNRHNENFLLSALTRMQTETGIEDEEAEFKAANNVDAKKIKQSMVSLAAGNLRLSRPANARTILTKRFMRENKVFNNNNNNNNNNIY